MGLVQRISNGMFWGQIGKILEAVVGFVFTVAVGRYLGPSGYGVYSLVMSLVGLAVALSSLGFSETLGKFAPKLLAAGNKAGLAYLFKFLLKARVIVIFVLVIALILLKGAFARIFPIPGFSAYSLFILTLVVTLGISDLLTSFFTALLRIKFLTVIRLVIQTATLILTLALFQLRTPAVSTVIFVAFLMSLCGAVVYLIQSGAYLFRTKSGSIPLKEIYRFSVSVWLINLATFALANHIDKILIGYLLKDTSQIGYYSVAATLLVCLHGSLTSGWGITILPALSEAYAKYGSIGMARVLSVYSKLLVVIMLPAVMFLGFHAHTVIFGLFRSEYFSCVHLLKVYILLDILTIIFVGGIMNFPLYVLGKEKSVLTLCLLSGILNIVLDFTLIPRYAALGAVVATGISTVVFSLAQLLLVFKHVPVRYPFKFIGKVFSSGLICLVPFYWIKIHRIWYLPLAGIFYAVLFFAALYFLRLLDPEDKEALIKLNPRFVLLTRYF